MPSDMWHYSRRALMMKSSVIRETLKIMQKPGVISFAGGLPASELFPKEELVECSQKVLREIGDISLQYGTTEGYPPLRELIAKRLAKEGIKVSSDEIVITSGSQQGLDMCGRVFLDWGDTVVSARPTYLGAIQAFSAYFPKYVTLPSDDEGMTTDGLKEILETCNPRLIYLVPTFQNPDGRTIPLHRRKRIIELARTFGVPIIEDDPYSELVFDGTIPTSMKALAPDEVIMLGTFSKLLAPGLRVAWLVAPHGAVDRFVRQKQGMDLHTSTFSQCLIYEFAQNGRLDSHIEKIKKVYSMRRNVMVEMMERYFPPEVKFTRPNGGLFLWVELPENVNTTELLPKAVEKSVAYIPGSAFYPEGGGHNTMRLNFSKPTEAEIEEGVKRLAEVFKDALRGK